MFQLQAEAPRLAEYQAYIDFEMKVGDPARIQLIFERALVENCLVPDLWIRYSQYLVRELLQFCFLQGRALHSGGTFLFPLPFPHCPAVLFVICIGICCI